MKRPTLPALSLLVVAAAVLSVSCAGSPRPRAAGTLSPGVELLLQSYPEAAPFPNSSFLEVEGNRLHYLSWLPPEGTATKGRVLLVHGFAASVYCWRFLGPALAGLGYLTVAVDCPPFGWSEPSVAELSGDGSGTPESRASLLWSFLDAMDALPGTGRASEAWILVGHSLGGRIAAWMASMRPDSTSALVLFAPAIFMDIGSQGLAASPSVQGWLSRNLGGLLESEDRIRSSLSRAYGRRPDDGEVAGYWAPFRRPGSLPALLAWSNMASEKRRPPLGTIRAPALVVWGSADAIVAPAGARLAAALPGAVHVEIKGGGHCVMETRFDEAWKAVSGFLATALP